jgi:CRISPR-associated protein Cmr1
LRSLKIKFFNIAIQCSGHQMQILEAQYQIVTPMFIGGAHQTDEPEIRPPSIKGALRFWWRALQWGSCLKGNGGHIGRALKELYQKEADLFGAAAIENRFGQGMCQIKLKQVQPQGIEKDWPRNNDAGAGFLGYGLDGTQNNPQHRQAIRQGKFTVCVTLKSGIQAEQIQQIHHALLAWGLLGGLGSRSRRGFGSVAIQKLDEQAFAFNRAETYFEAIKTLIDGVELAPSMPIYTAFNSSLRIAKAGQGQDPRRLMDKLGGQYREARKQAGKGLAKLPYGLPLAGNRGASDEKNRRSSPLLMHIHPAGTEYVAVATLIPAHFHPAYSPEGDQIEFYRPIQAFMDTLEKVYP